MNNFITPEFKAEIKREVIEHTFPNLNIEHQNLLLTMLIDILDVIAIKFNYDYKNKQLYNERFRLNSYRDLKGLLNLLLPYIDENPDDNISKKNIRSLNDIYISKKELNADPTKESVKYLYSNIQYSRCKRDPIEEINFSPEHLKHNYYLLLETIQTVSNKLYINWLDILPYDALRGNLYELYKYTHKALKEKNIGYWDVCKNDKNRNYKGLYIGDIYNTIHNEDTSLVVRRSSVRSCGGWDVRP